MVKKNGVQIDFKVRGSGDGTHMNSSYRAIAFPTKMLFCIMHGSKRLDQDRPGSFVSWLLFVLTLHILWLLVHGVHQNLLMVLRISWGPEKMNFPMRSHS